MNDVTKRRSKPSPRHRRAGWALILTICLTIAAAASAQAGSGGVSATSADGDGSRQKMKRSLATWYGPGLWGNRTACGQRLRKKTEGVAHRRLPCGTKIKIAYKGRTVRTRVIDRGPYAHGAKWDLTKATANDVGMKATSTIRTAVIR